MTTTAPYNINFDRLPCNPDVGVLASTLFRTDRHLAVYFNFVPPLLADDVLKLLCVPEARYFFNLFEKQEHQQGKKNYVGIAGLLQYGQRHGGRDLFISIKPDILSEYPDGFRTAIENLRFWYFANFSDPFLYMTRIAADPFNDVIEALASRKYEGDKIWAQGQWRETERFELQAP